MTKNELKIYEYIYLFSYFMFYDYLCNRADCPCTAIIPFIAPLPTPPTTLQFQ